MSETPRCTFDPQAGLKGLPFVRHIGPGSCFWCAPSTGDQNLDFELGSLYGLMLLKFLRAEHLDSKRADVDPEEDPAGEFVELVMVVRAMIRKGRHDNAEDGFLSVLERYLVHCLRPEGGWVDVSAELDSHSWDWFEAECKRIWSGAPLRGQLHDECCVK